ncbi:MAG: hypothetical protein AABZ84_02000 [Pseudomonadota bacterium]
MMAVVVADFVTPKPLVTVASEAFARYCNANALADNVNLATDERAGSYAFFDTSWLPSFREFTAVANDRDKGQTLWNPLGMSWLTGEQLDLLGLAFQIGYEDGGESHAKFLQAVLMQETIAGQLGRLGHLSAPMGKRSYGVMQVKVPAARDVLRHKPQLGHFRTDEQLIARLIADDEFNLRIASAYLKYLRKLSGSDHQALVAYNVGPNAAKNVVDPAQFKYVQRVELYMSKVVEPFNGKFAAETGRAAKRV